MPYFRLAVPEAFVYYIDAMRMTARKMKNFTDDARDGKLRMAAEH